MLDTPGIDNCVSVPQPEGPKSAAAPEQHLFKGNRVAVIGGGNPGVEAAIDLAGIVQQVARLESCDQLRTPLPPPLPTANAD